MGNEDASYGLFSGGNICLGRRDGMSIDISVACAGSWCTIIEAGMGIRYVPF